MAKRNKVYVDVVVDDKGTTKKVALSQKQAAKAFEETGVKAGQADRNIKGTAQTSANTTKNFSKMSQGMGGLVGAYATLAANVFALSAAFQFLKTAGDLAALTKGQEIYAARTGTSMKLLTSQLQEATGGIVAFNEAAQAAAIGNAAGLTADQMTRLATVAKNAGTVLGRDVTDSFNRLTRGAIKAEPELLDELGIIVRLKDASEEYAKALNKNANDLTTFEKSQAVVNAVLTQGEAKFKDIGDEVNTMAQLGKEISDLMKDVKTAIEPVATFIANALIGNIEGLIAAFSLLGVGIVKAIAPAAPQLENLAAAAEKAKARISASSAIQKTTATGRDVAAGTFEQKQLATLERAVKAKNSTVIKGSKQEKDAIRKDLAIIKADHQRTMAANSRGFSRYVAEAKANMYTLQAEHGKVMGTMKAAVGGFARFASRAMNAIAILGIITMAIQLAKELLDLLKSDELKKAERTSEALIAKFKEQSEAIQEVQDSLETARSPMENLVQQANLLSNFSYDGLITAVNRLETLDVKDISANKVMLERAEKYLQTLKESGTATERAILLQEAAVKRLQEQTQIAPRLRIADPQLAKQNENYINGISASLANLTNQFELLQDNKIIDQKPAELEAVASALELLKEGANADNIEEYNNALTTVSENMPKLLKSAQAGTGAMNAQKAAFTALTQELEGFTKAAEKIKLPDSKFSSFYSSLDNTEQSLKTLKQTIGDKTLYEAFAGEKGFEDGIVQFKALLKLLGLANNESAKGLTYDEAITKLAERRSRFLTIEYELELAKLNLQTKFIRAGIGATTGQKARLSLQQKEAEAAQALDEFRKNYKLQLESGNKLSEEQLRVMGAQEQQLVATLQAAQALNNEFEQMNLVIKNSFEQGLQAGISSLLKGKATLKEAIAGFATTIAESIIDKAAKTATDVIVDSLFGKKDSPEEKMQAGIVAGSVAGAEAQKKAIIEGGTIAAQQMAQATGNSITPSTMINQPTDTAVVSGTTEAVQEKTTFKTLLSNLFGSGPSAADKFAAAGAAGKVNGGVMPQTGEGVLEEVLVKGAKAPTGLTKLFDGFTANIGEIIGGEVPFLQGIKNLFGDFGSDLGGIFSTLLNDLGGIFSGLFGGGGAGGGGGLLSTLFSVGASMFGIPMPFARTGGIMEEYASGGIAKGRKAGYPAILHGTEAVVPLPNGRQIPVEFNSPANSGMSAQTNNVVVNVSVDNQGNGSTSAESSDSRIGENLGQVVAKAVQAELQNQKRPGGILSPYGV